MTLRFRPEVVSDLMATREWYEDRRAGLGDEFISVIDALLERVDSTPEQFPAVYDVVRRGLLRRFPYAVYFYQEGEDTVVLGILHQAVSPKRWPRP